MLLCQVLSDGHVPRILYTPCCTRRKGAPAAIRNSDARLEGARTRLHGRTLDRKPYTTRNDVDTAMRRRDDPCVFIALYKQMVRPYDGRPTLKWADDRLVS